MATGAEHGRPSRPVLQSESSGPAWEGLGWAAWWLADEELTIRARQNAFRAYRDAADPGGAARVAAWLASDSGSFAAARARRC